MSGAGFRSVVCAAIRHPDGRIVCGPRHFDHTMWRQILGLSGTAFLEGPLPDHARSWRSAEQGFIDQDGVFLTREQAWPIAVAQRPLLDPDWQRGVLYSEHLY